MDEIGRVQPARERRVHKDVRNPEILEYVERRFLKDVRTKKVMDSAQIKVIQRFQHFYVSTAANCHKCEDQNYHNTDYTS